MDSFFDRVKLILKNQYKGEYNHSCVSRLNEETQVVGDLEIYGDDADEFIYLFCKEFKLNGDQFTFGKYFGMENEGADFITPILRFFFKNKTSIPKEPHERYLITLGDLKFCAEGGELSDSLIEKSRHKRSSGNFK